MNNPPNNITIIQKLLEELQTTQRDDGSFPGYALERDSVRPSSAIFGTACISTVLGALAAAFPLAQAMLEKATDYLMEQKRPDGSFSYWERGSPEDRVSPYPPDLDDTALSTAALLQVGSYAADGKLLADFVRLLSDSEIAEGGPYKTWIIEDPRWDDVDIAVNANIAFALQLVGVQLDPLQQYIDTAITSENISSRYYHLPLLPFFFIARTYAGIQHERAAEYIFCQQHAGQWQSRTETALAVCALSFFDPHFNQHPAVRDAIAQIRDAVRETEVSKTEVSEIKASETSAPLDPLFRERIKEGSDIFYANPSVTQVLRAYALHRYDTAESACGNAAQNPETAADPGDAAIEEKIVQRYIAQCSAVSDAYGIAATRHVHALLQDSISKDAAVLPFIFSRMFRHPAPVAEETIEQLCLAHLFGWIGYTLIDEIMDGECGRGELPFALAHIRSFTAMYRLLLPDPDYRLFSACMNDTERAFEEEYASALQKTDTEDSSYRLDSVAPPSVPAWQKSMGHALPILAILLRSGYDEKSDAFARTKTFFQSFLLARQLHDDAHDYIEDLSNGRVTSVGYAVLKRFLELNTERHAYALPNDEAAFRSIFWHDCFPAIHAQIDTAIAEARHALARMPLTDTAYFDRLLDKLSGAQVRAATERNRMLSFIAAY